MATNIFTYKRYVVVIIIVVEIILTQQEEMFHSVLSLLAKNNNNNSGNSNTNNHYNNNTNNNNYDRTIQNCGTSSTPSLEHLTAALQEVTESPQPTYVGVSETLSIATESERVLQLALSAVIQGSTRSFPSPVAAAVTSFLTSSPTFASTESQEVNVDQVVVGQQRSVVGGVIICPSSPLSTDSVHRQRQMYARFQAWALSNYGEAGKTKTVTRAKYNRVRKLLQGDEQASADNSKLRFWVKAKGFRLGKASKLLADREDERTDVLYIPSKV